MGPRRFGPWPAGQFGSWFWPVLVLAGLLQAALFAYATAPGLAGTADSGFYLHAARTLRAAGHLLHPDGSAYRYWPPLYPVLLAGVGGAAGVRWLHGFCLIISLVVWSLLGRQWLAGGRAAVLPLLLALGTPWLLVGKFVWGETVFLALFAGYVGALAGGLRTGRGGWLALATALGFLLPLQRTVGFFLLAGMGVGLLAFAGRHHHWRGAVPRHLALSSAGGLLWHYYALLLAAPGAGVYRVNKGWAQFFSSAADYGFVLGRWLLPLRAEWRTALPGALWAALLPALLLLLWPREKQAETLVSTDFDHQLPRPPLPRLLWSGAVAFVLLLLVATTFTRSAPGLHDAERYASVLYAPVLLLGLRRWPAGRWPRWLGALALTGWLLYSGARVVGNARQLRQLPVVKAADYSGSQAGVQGEVAPTLSWRRCPDSRPAPAPGSPPTESWRYKYGK